MTGKKYEFTDAYLTGIPSIDEEHARLFEIANEVYDLLEDELVTDKYDRIVEMIDELRAYTKTHFANEEAYMERIGFPHIYGASAVRIAFSSRSLKRSIWARSIIARTLTFSRFLIFLQSG